MSADERELHTAWQRHVGTGATADAWFDSVVNRHRAPGRHYHDLRHVRWVVQHVRELAPSTAPPRTDDDVDRLVAAACFHDVVYDATHHDNEARSADLARRALDELGWTADAVEHVAAMIEATAGHTSDADDPAHDDLTTAVLLAADLGVLATEPNRYDDYVRNVRREYAHLDDDAWRVGRAAFVDAMLARDHIFPTVLGLDQWERRARANLTAERAAASTVSAVRDAGGEPEP
jgi:predicted metal-dependent HD superfamily phosphohydrolase